MSFCGASARKYPCRIPGPLRLKLNLSAPPQYEILSYFSDLNGELYLDTAYLYRFGSAL